MQQLLLYAHQLTITPIIRLTFHLLVSGIEPRFTDYSMGWDYIRTSISGSDFVVFKSL